MTVLCFDFFNWAPFRLRVTSIAKHCDQSRQNHKRNGSEKTLSAFWNMEKNSISSREWKVPLLKRFVNLLKCVSILQFKMGLDVPFEQCLAFFFLHDIEHSQKQLTLQSIWIVFMHLQKRKLSDKLRYVVQYW